MISISKTVSAIISTRTKQHAFRRIGDVAVLVNAPREFNDEEWHEFIELSAEQLDKYGKYARGVNFCPEYGPNSSQRAYMKTQQHRIIDENFKRMALVTDSVMVRGGITALGWLMRANFPVRAFSVKEHIEAVQWAVEGTRYDAAQIYDILQELVVYCGYRALR